MPCSPAARTHLRRPAARRRHRGHPLHAAGRRPRRTADQRRRGRADPAGHPQLPHLNSPNPDPPDVKAVLLAVASIPPEEAHRHRADRRRPQTGHHQWGHRPGEPAGPDQRSDGAAPRRTIQAGGGTSGGGRTGPPGRPAHPARDVLGRIADYERAAELAQVLVRDAPEDGAPWLARARTGRHLRRGTRRPRRRGAVRCGPGHVGCGAGGDPPGGRVLRRVLCCAGTQRSAGPTSRRWVRWPCSRLRAGRSPRRSACSPSAAALPGCLAVPGRLARLPARPDVARPARPPRPVPGSTSLGPGAGLRSGAGSPCRGRRGLGARDAAINRLRPLAASSDDPEYAASLASVLSGAGQPVEPSNGA